MISGGPRSTAIRRRSPGARYQGKGPEDEAPLPGRGAGQEGDRTRTRLVSGLKRGAAHAGCHASEERAASPTDPSIVRMTLLIAAYASFAARYRKSDTESERDEFRYPHSATLLAAGFLR